MLLEWTDSQVSQYQTPRRYPLCHVIYSSDPRTWSCSCQPFQDVNQSATTWYHYCPISLHNVTVTYTMLLSKLIIRWKSSTLSSTQLWQRNSALLESLNQKIQKLPEVFCRGGSGSKLRALPINPKPVFLENQAKPWTRSSVISIIIKEVLLSPSLFQYQNRINLG